MSSINNDDCYRFSDVIVDDKIYHINERRLTVHQIKSIAGILQENTLQHYSDDGSATDIDNDHIILFPTSLKFQTKPRLESS